MQISNDDINRDLTTNEDLLRSTRGESLDELIDAHLYFWRLVPEASIQSEFIELILTCRLLGVSVTRLLDISAENAVHERSK